MRIQIFDVCWVYAYKFKALAEHTLTKSLIFLLVTAVWSAYAYKFNAFAEHTHTNLRRMLSMRVQIHNVCWVCAYKFITYAEHTHTNLSRMLSIRVQIHNVCWVCAYKVFQQKEIVTVIGSNVVSGLYVVMGNTKISYCIQYFGSGSARIGNFLPIRIRIRIRYNLTSRIRIQIQIYYWGSGLLYEKWSDKDTIYDIKSSGSGSEITLAVGSGSDITRQVGSRSGSVMSYQVGSGSINNSSDPQHWSYHLVMSSVYQILL